MNAGIEINKSLQKQIDEKIAQISAIENYFPGVVIIHEIKHGTVIYMSQWGCDYLGVTNEELKLMGTEYYNNFFNSEDAKDYVPKVLALLERNNDAEFVCHFQQVRRSIDSDWAWFLTATRIFLRDEAGQPFLTLTTSLPVEAQHHIAMKAQRLLEENNFLRNNLHIFNQLTKREKDIITRMALGQTSSQIASELYISEATANTHRRNIRKKINAATAYDITRFAQAYNLI